MRDQQTALAQMADRLVGDAARQSKDQLEKMQVRFKLREIKLEGNFE